MQSNNVRKNGAVKLVLGVIGSSINPAGVSVSDLAALTGKTKKQINQAIYNLGDRIGKIKSTRESRYFASQALADASEQKARESLQRYKILRMPKKMAQLAEIKSLYKSSADTFTSVQIKEMLGRSDDQRFGEAIYELADMGELHRYGGHRLTRYAIVPFTPEMIAAAEKMRVEAVALRKLKKSRKQRALSKCPRRGLSGSGGSNPSPRHCMSRSRLISSTMAVSSGDSAADRSGSACAISSDILDSRLIRRYTCGTASAFYVQGRSTSDLPPSRHTASSQRRGCIRRAAGG